MKAMKAIQEKKADSNIIMVEAPKGRGFMPPPSRTFQNKKRKQLLKKYRFVN